MPQHSDAPDARTTTSPVQGRVPVHAAEIWSGFALALITLILVGAVAMLMTKRLARSSATVGHTYVIIERLNRLQLQLASVQSEIRAYLPTASTSTLAAAREARSSIAEILREIRRLAADDPEQAAPAEKLAAVVTRDLDRLDQLIVIENSKGSAAARESVRAQRAVPIATDANQRIAQMIAVERALLRHRQSAEQDSARMATRAIIYGMLAAVAFVVFAGVYLYRALRILHTTTLLAERSAREASERREELTRQAEAARLGREQFMGLLESATDAILTVGTDGRIAYANGRTAKYFGYSVPELLEMEIEQLVPQASQDEHRRYRAEFVRQPRVRAMAPSLDLCAVRKDGTEFPVEVNLSPVTGGNGTQVLATVRDITQARRAQEYLGRISALVEASRYSIVSYKLDGSVLTWNGGARVLYGWSPDEVIGRNVSVIIPDQCMAQHLRQIEDIAAGKGAQEYEAARRRKDGSLVQVAVSKAPIHDSHGRVVAISTISYDITQRVSAERELRARTEELARSNAELEQFAYVASHDLQEPLRMVASYLQLIEQRYRGRLDSDADDFINYAVDGARRMKQLINDLLNLSRAGRATEPHPIELDRALKRATAMLAFAIEEGHSVLTVDPLPRVMGDEASLAEVFQNLISNAIKFRSAAPPRIRIGVRRENGCWVISVADNGIGIDPAYRERIFAMLQRLHAREKFPGTGMGLAICKRIVERIGGRIWVESGPGCGATFRFTVPVAEDETVARNPIAQS